MTNFLKYGKIVVTAIFAAIVSQKRTIKKGKGKSMYGAKIVSALEKANQGTVFHLTGDVVKTEKPEVVKIPTEIGCYGNRQLFVGDPQKEGSYEEVVLTSR